MSDATSQSWPGAVGEHANPVAGASGRGVPGGERRGQGVFAPGEALLPEPAPGMAPTGAETGPHAPAPPYGGVDRRLAQHDWDRWRAEDRRGGAHRYPDWRT